MERETIQIRLARAGLYLLAVLCLCRAMIEHDPFPWWASDPFSFAPPIIGLTPRWALLLNILITLTAAFTCLIQAIRGYSIARITSVLILVGGASLAFHALNTESTLDTSIIIAVIASVCAASTAHTIPGARRVLLGIALGFASMITCIGLYEVFVSHPITVEMYEQTRESFLASRGWSEGSFEALSYERRLKNPEPVAWFGLTNVFATFCAASSAGLLGVGLAKSDEKQRSKRIFLMLAAAFSVIGLVLTGSKGGYGVLGVVICLCLLLTVRPNRQPSGRFLLGLCSFIVLGLMIRGAVGERIGELSLLFRWQYLVGAFSIWMHDPFLGCGPGVFQEQYALLKPALSPEDVASPHNFVAYWIATLGIGGLALTSLLTLLLIRTTPSNHITEPQSVEDDPDRTEKDTKAVALIVILPMLAALQIQTRVMTLSQMLPILIGAGLMGSIAILVVRTSLNERIIRVGLFLVAAALVTHAMIEVSGTLIVSAPLWGLMIGAFCTGAIPNGQNSWFRWTTPAALTSLGILLLVRWTPINAWERNLHLAASDAVQISQLHSTLNELEHAAVPQELLSSAQRQIQSLTGQLVPQNLDSIVPAMHQAEVQARFASLEPLQAALAARPAHTPTRVALSQQLLWLASVAQRSQNPQMTIELWDRAVDLFEGNSLSAGGHRWAGNIWSARSTSFPSDTQTSLWLSKAREHWEQAMMLAPHDPATALRLMDLCVELGDLEGAAHWARRSLVLNEEARLDPLRELTEGDRARAEDIAAEP